MVKDLESIHETLLGAYKAIMLLSGVDLDALAETAAKQDAPTRHVPI